MSGDAWKEGGIDATGNKYIIFLLTRVSVREVLANSLDVDRLFFKISLLLNRCIDGADAEGDIMWYELQRWNIERG